MHLFLLANTKVFDNTKRVVVRSVLDFIVPEQSGSHPDLSALPKIPTVAELCKI